MSRGRIEVITGCMFGGKSEELVRRLRRAQIAKKRVGAFKHASDDRYDPVNIGCHTGVTFVAKPCHNVGDLNKMAQGLDVIGIDEAQFFLPVLIEFCEDKANSGVRVIVAGLDLDSNGQLFGPIPALMAMAEDVTKLSAVCVSCGEPASRTFHKGPKEHQVEVGASQYEARCRSCWNAKGE